MSTLLAAARVRTLFVALSAFLLAACGHTPVTRTLFDAIPGFGKSFDDFPLASHLRYLRVSVRGRTALLVLGYLEPHPEGEIETWYSSEGEVLRLQNGRIVGTGGLETDWRAVRYSGLPAWKDLSGRGTVAYRRERDEMPGYRFGIADTVSLYPVRVPNNAKLVRVKAEGLSWYEEAVQGQPDGLPSARFALDAKGGVPRVIYGEYCLSKTFCLAWQTWPATP